VKITRKIFVILSIIFLSLLVLTIILFLYLQSHPPYSTWLVLLLCLVIILLLYFGFCLLTYYDWLSKMRAIYGNENEVEKYHYIKCPGKAKPHFVFECGGKLIKLFPHTHLHLCEGIYEYGIYNQWNYRGCPFFLPFLPKFLPWDYIKRIRTIHHPKGGGVFYIVETNDLRIGHFCEYDPQFRKIYADIWKKYNIEIVENPPGQGIYTHTDILRLKKKRRGENEGM